MRSRKRFWAISTVVLVAVAMLVYFLIQDSDSSGGMDSQRNRSKPEESVRVDMQVPDSVQRIFEDRIAAQGFGQPAVTSTSTLNELRNDTGLDDISLLRYLIVYESELKDDIKSMMAVFMRNEFIREMNRGDVIVGALPLYTSDDYMTSHSAYESLSLALLRDGQYDFSPFEQVLLQMEENEAQLLARFMYRKAPDQAIHALADVFEDNSRRKSEIQELIPRFSASLKEVDKYTDFVNAPSVSSALAAFAEDDRWWVRMYAARTLKDYWGLRDKKLVDQLRNDPNVHVRGFLEGLSPSRLYKQEPLPGREAGAEAIRWRTERLRELQRRGALDDVVD